MNWWARQGSNLHGLLHRILSPARLPIPPRAHAAQDTQRLAVSGKRPSSVQKETVSRHWLTIRPVRRQPAAVNVRQAIQQLAPRKPELGASADCPRRTGSGGSSRRRHLADDGEGESGKAIWRQPLNPTRVKNTSKNDAARSSPPLPRRQRNGKSLPPRSGESIKVRSTCDTSQPITRRRNSGAKASNAPGVAHQDGQASEGKRWKSVLHRER